MKKRIPKNLRAREIWLKMFMVFNIFLKYRLTGGHLSRLLKIFLCELTLQRHNMLIFGRSNFIQVFILYKFYIKFDNILYLGPKIKWQSFM